MTDRSHVEGVANLLGAGDRSHAWQRLLNKLALVNQYYRSFVEASKASEEGEVAERAGSLGVASQEQQRAHDYKAKALIIDSQFGVGEIAEVATAGRFSH